MEKEILDISKKVYSLLSKDGTCNGQAEQVAQLINKLENKTMTVSVIGQFKRGKSTLANKILEDNILPVGIVPITSAVTKVVYGEKAAQVNFQNGATEQIAFEQLSGFISEQENSNNKLGVSEVILHAPSDFLKNGLTFVDTPGVGSFHKNNTETAVKYMKESDGVIFLLSVDSPINQIEIDFLENTKEFAAKFYFAVNKVDTVSVDDLNSYMEYCTKILGELMSTQDIKLFPVSGKSGAGVEELKYEIIKDCKKSAEEILKASTEKKLKSVIGAALMQLNFYWKAMNMEYGQLDEKFHNINATINELKIESDKYRDNFQIHINEIKLLLSNKVKDLFGMEYYYDLEEVQYNADSIKKDDFIEQRDTICENLENTLDSILLYREENAYTVVRRIYNINRLTSQLRKIEKEL